MRMLKDALKPVDPKGKGVEEGELGLGVLEEEIPCRARGAAPPEGEGRGGKAEEPLPLPKDPLKAGHRYRVLAAAGGKASAPVA